MALTPGAQIRHRHIIRTDRRSKLSHLRGQKITERVLRMDIVFVGRVWRQAIDLKLVGVDHLGIISKTLPVAGPHRAHIDRTVSRSVGGPLQEHARRGRRRPVGVVDKAGLGKPTALPVHHIPQRIIGCRRHAPARAYRAGQAVEPVVIHGRAKTPAVHHLHGVALGVITKPAYPIVRQDIRVAQLPLRQQPAHPVVVVLDHLVVVMHPRPRAALGIAHRLVVAVGQHPVPREIVAVLRVDPAVVDRPDLPVRLIVAVVDRLSVHLHLADQVAERVVPHLTHRPVALAGAHIAVGLDIHPIIGREVDPGVAVAPVVLVGGGPVPHHLLTQVAHRIVGIRAGIGLTDRRDLLNGQLRR